jgi:hypothetical protein
MWYWCHDIGLVLASSIAFRQTLLVPFNENFDVLLATIQRLVMHNPTFVCLLSLAFEQCGRGSILHSRTWADKMAIVRRTLEMAQSFVVRGGRRIILEIVVRRVVIVIGRIIIRG